MFELDSEQRQELETRLMKQAGVWLSWTVRLAGERPASEAFAILEQGEQAQAGARFFWQTPTKNLTLIGVEQMTAIRLEETDQRVTEFEEWKAQLDKHLCTFGPQPSGSGPLVFGGLTFDTLPKEGTEWEPFGHGYFRVPRYLWSYQADGQAFLTWNSWFEDGAAFREQQKQAEAYGKAILKVLATPKVRDSAATKIRAQKELEVANWQAQVASVVEQIKQNQGLKKVVMSRKMAISFDGTPSFAHLLQELAATQTGTYLIGLELGTDFYLSATPERLLAANETYYSSACVAGTAARGATPLEDQLLGEELLQDTKNGHEHDFVVAQIQADLRQIGRSEPQISEQKTLLKTRDVQHLFLTVQTERGTSPRFLEAVAALNPTPALGGVPTQEALKIIAEQEKTSRGWYGAPVGWVDQADQGEFAVAIRSAQFHTNQAILYAGCGIVEDSDPAAEVSETRLKFRPLVRAIGGNLNE